MRRRVSTDFEFGDIESVIKVTPAQGIDDISPATMNSLHAHGNIQLMEHVVSVLAWSIESLELKIDEIERSSDTVISLSIAGYTCELTVRLTLNVELAPDYAKALVALAIGPKFAALATQTLGFCSVDESLRRNPAYQKLLVQKLTEAAKKY